MPSAQSRQKVAHLTSVHTPADTRIAFRECAALAEAGYQVVLIAPGSADGLPKGVRLRSLPLPRNRVERVTSTMQQLLRAAVDENADFYHFHDPELIFVGLLLKMRGARVIFDVHEDIPNDIADKHWIPRPLRAPVGVLAKFALRVLQRRYSAVVAATPGIAKLFPDGNAVVVCNYPRLDELQVPGAREFANRPRQAVYLGNITELRGIVELMDAFASPKMSDGIRLTLAGQFEDEMLEGRVRAMPAWPKADFLGWCNRADVARVLGQARVGLITLRPARNFTDSLPVKLFEYMAAGLPVVISETIRASEIVREFDCGLVVNPLDPDAIAEAISRIVDNPDLAQDMGRRGRNLVLERYQWINEAQKLRNLYARIA